MALVALVLLAAAWADAGCRNEATESNCNALVTKGHCSNASALFDFMSGNCKKTCGFAPCLAPTPVQFVARTTTTTTLTSTTTTTVAPNTTAPTSTTSTSTSVDASKCAGHVIGDVVLTRVDGVEFSTAGGRGATTGDAIASSVMAKANVVLAGAAAVACAKTELKRAGAIVTLHAPASARLIEVHVAANLLYPNISARTGWFAVGVELDGVRTTLAARMFLTTQIIPVVRSTAPPDNTTQAVTTVPAGPTTFGPPGANATGSGTNTSTPRAASGSSSEDEETELIIAIGMFVAIVLCSTTLFVLLLYHRHNNIRRSNLVLDAVTAKHDRERATLGSPDMHKMMSVTPGPPREPSVDGVLLSDGHFYPEQQDRSGAQDVLVMPMPGSQPNQAPRDAGPGNSNGHFYPGAGAQVNRV